MQLDVFLDEGGDVRRENFEMVRRVRLAVQGGAEMFVVELEGSVNVSSAAQRGVAERSVQTLSVGFELQGNVMESELLDAEIPDAEGEQPFAGAAGEIEVFESSFKFDEVGADAEG